MIAHDGIDINMCLKIDRTNCDFVTGIVEKNCGWSQRKMKIFPSMK